MDGAPVCDGSKGLTLDVEESSSTHNQCICDTSIAGISTSTSYSEFAINQGSCLCDSTGYTSEYNGSTCRLILLVDLLLVIQDLFVMSLKD